MDSNPNMNDCTDSTQTITVELPCAMVERIMKLANENDTPLSNLLIEALDQFLRNQG
ncbi:MAG: ribbon-helix-helix domain-containing protein [Desulfobacterales bacterium]|nr:ribbon-helix-helix domain-containing protein [Desulfobacterales bacterium]